MSTKRKLVAAIAAGTLLAVGLFAQGPIRQHMAGGHAAFLATYLDLTDVQKAQAKSIFESAKANADPVVTKLRQGHEQMAELVKGGGADAQIDALAFQQGAQAGQVAAIYAKAFKQFYLVLTPEQQGKAGKLHDQFKTMIQQHSVGPHFGGF